MTRRTPTPPGKPLAAATQPSDQFRLDMEARLAEQFDSLIKAAPNEAGRQLLKRARAVALRAGKRSRPELMYLTYRAYDGRLGRQLAALGAALELLHQAFLIHDDITDNDIVRYDGPNVIGYYAAEFSRRPHDTPAAMGLLAGNILFSGACQAVLECPGLPAAKRSALLQLLLTTTIGTNYGQQLDIYNTLEAGTPSAAAAPLIARFKTALYSTRLPMLWAAELLELEPLERANISAFAVQFGIAYQQIDDFSDYFSNRTAFDSRPKFRDFREGKPTFPLVFALEHAGPKEQAFLRRSAGRKTASDASLKKAVAILEACGAREAARRQAAQSLARAGQLLDALAMTAAGRRRFQELLGRYMV